MKNRVHITVSIPQDFKDKFMGFIKNLNTLNDNDDDKVIVERMYLKKKFAITPKKESE